MGRKSSIRHKSMGLEELCHCLSVALERREHRSPESWALALQNLEVVSAWLKGEGQTICKFNAHGQCVPNSEVGDYHFLVKVPYGHRPPPYESRAKDAARSVTGTGTVCWFFRIDRDRRCLVFRVRCPEEYVELLIAA